LTKFNIRFEVNQDIHWSYCCFLEEYNITVFFLLIQPGTALNFMFLLFFSLFLFLFIYIGYYSSNFSITNLLNQIFQISSSFNLVLFHIAAISQFNLFESNASQTISKFLKWHVHFWFVPLYCFSCKVEIRVAYDTMWWNDKGLKGIQKWNLLYQRAQSGFHLKNKP
jgi:hypothetical protein